MRNYENRWCHSTYRLRKVAERAVSKRNQSWNTTNWINRNSLVPPILKLGDLREWCRKHESFPSDVNEAFVLSHEYSSVFVKDLNFRFILSTPLLLEKLMHAKSICIDATYKLNWLSFPLIVLGRVDLNKRFHPLAYACCSHEKKEDYMFVFESVKKAIRDHLNAEFEPEIIVADGADAIRNAWYEVFESAMHTLLEIVGNGRLHQKTTNSSSWKIFAQCS